MRLPSRRETIVAAAVAAASIVAAVTSLRRDDPRSVPSMAFVRHTEGGDRAVWEAGGRTAERISPPGLVSFAPAWSGCGGGLAFVGKEGDGRFGVYLGVGQAAEPLTESDGPVSDLDWTPDGTALIFPRVIGTGQELVRLEVGDGAERILARRDAVTIGQVSVNPVSGQLAIGELGSGDRSSVRLLAADGTDTGEQWAGIAPSWSPDGQSIAFVRQADEGWELVIRRGEVSRVVARSARLLYGPSWAEGARSILVERDRGEGSEIVLVDVATGRTEHLGLPNGDDSLGAPAAKLRCAAGQTTGD